MRLTINDAREAGDYLAVRPMNFGQPCHGRDVHSYVLRVELSDAVEMVTSDYLELQADTLEHGDATEEWERDLERYSDLPTFVSKSTDAGAFFRFMAHELLLRIESAGAGEARYVANTVESVELEGDWLAIRGRAYPWPGS